MTVAGIHLRRDRGQATLEDFAWPCLHGDSRGHARPQAAGFEFRDACFELQRSQIRHGDNRLVAGADEAPSVVVALDDDAVDR